jgi:hypothetical protein
MPAVALAVFGLGIIAGAAIAGWVTWTLTTRLHERKVRKLEDQWADTAKAELDVAFQRGREYEREVLARQARFTSSTPEMN